MDRGTWWATVCGVTESRTDWVTNTHSEADQEIKIQAVYLRDDPRKRVRLGESEMGKKEQPVSVGFQASFHCG